MHPFLRLFSFILKYRWPFIAGVGVSFLVAILNGLSLTAFIPLFDALGDRRARFTLQFSITERSILQYVVNSFPTMDFISPENPEGKKPDVPPSPEKIERPLARTYLSLLHRRQNFPLSPVNELLLRTIITWKLKINASGYSPLMVVYTAAAVVFPLYIIKLILMLLSVKLIARSGYQSVRDIRHKLYEKVQRLPLTYFYKERTGIIMSRLINDVEIVAAVISSNMRDAITNVFYVLVNLVILSYLNYKLLLISAVTVPLILSPVTLFSRKIRRSTHRSQELLGELNAHLQESIQGVRVIRSTGAEEYELNRFRGVNQRLYWRKFKQDFYLKMGPNMVELFSALVTVGIIALGAFFLHPSDFTGGEFMAFLVTLLFIIRPIIQLSGMYSKVHAASAAGTRIFEIMDKERESNDPPHPLRLDPMKRGIVFEDVHFTYPETDREVISGVDLEVPAGKTVALVGESGGGKSTLMDLLARFFEPESGRILIDGNDIRDFRIADHRARIGIVTQEIFLFHGTIHENISYGHSSYSRYDVERAARLAHAHDFIREFPDGYDTMLGERGLTLSGGQRQRIAIARALLRDPEILILDEATSSLDTESERIVQQALDRLFKNRTTFVIAHRLSTIESADMILVISGGKIIDRGTHEDLMNREGLYARLQAISRHAEDLK